MPEQDQTPLDQVPEGQVQDSDGEVESGKVKKQKKKREPERQDATTLHERTIAMLSYFGPFAIVPFYLKKDSEFCRFHGKQGMIVALIFFMARIFTVLGLFMDIFLVLQFIILIQMGFAALSGRWKRMPLIYKWACDLEDSISLKTKEEELEEAGLSPNEVVVEDVSSPTADSNSSE